jgi:hypothetical protein
VTKGSGIGVNPGKLTSLIKDKEVGCILTSVGHKDVFFGLFREKAAIQATFMNWVSYLPTDTAVPVATDRCMLQVVSTGCLSHLGVEVFYVMDDSEGAEEAKRRNTTRAAVAASIINPLAIMALEEVPS